MKPSTTWPSFIAKTAGIDCTWKAWLMAGFSSMLTLASTTLPSVASVTFSRIGPSVWHGPHHGAQRSITTGVGLRSLDHIGIERCVGDIDRHGDHDTGESPTATRAAIAGRGVAAER